MKTISNKCNSNKQIIENNNKAGCKSCDAPTSGRAYLEDLDVYLGRVRNFVKNHGDKTGSNEIKQLMMNGKDNQISAVAQTVRLLDEFGGAGAKFSADKVKAFEVKIGNQTDAALADAKHPKEADILVEFVVDNSIRKKFYELKSFASTNLSSNIKGRADQLIGYLKNGELKNIVDLEYIFDKRKLLSEIHSGYPYGSIVAA